MYSYFEGRTCITDIARFPLIHLEALSKILRNRIGHSRLYGQIRMWYHALPKFVQYIERLFYFRV